MFKYALKQNYITKEDFYKYNDKEIIAKICTYDSDNFLNKLLGNLSQKNYKQFIKNDSDKCYENILCKFRRVDPYVLQNGKLKRLSAYNEKIKQDFMENTPKYKMYKVLSLV